MEAEAEVAMELAFRKEFKSNEEEEEIDEDEDDGKRKAAEAIVDKRANRRTAEVMIVFMLSRCVCVW